MADDVVIRVQGLWKRYGLPVMPALRRYWHTLRNGRGSSSVVGRPQDEGPWALRDINLEVRRGETLGIIGRNGAGKSTLLKVLAGVTPPTRGKVEVRGRVFPMIELNAGLHRELTGRENVRLLGAIMGLSRPEIEAKMPEIEEFCELGKWFDRPVRMYSSGMLARLGFAVAVNVDADLLLIDEVLAVGDLGFQRKCFGSIADRRREGRAALLVSHSLRQVQRLCDIVMLLDCGNCVNIGDASEVVAQYERSSSEKELSRGLSLEVPYTSVDENLVALKGMEVLDADGQLTRQIEFGKQMRLRFHFFCGQSLDWVSLGIGIISTDNVYITGSSSDGVAESSLAAGHNIVECQIDNLPLRPGVYGITISLRGPEAARILGSKRPTYFEVVSSDPSLSLNSYGLIHMDAHWHFAQGTG